VGPLFYITFLCVGAILVELIYVLDVPSAFAGVGCTFLVIPAMIILAQSFAKYRGQTAGSTDARVRYASEVIEGIASVKSYAWETAFFQMIRQLRSKETKYIGRSQVLRAVNQGLMFCTASVVAFATFGVYWGNGGLLTIPIVFSTLSLIQVLRFQIGRGFTRSIETGSEAIASCLRIQKFLDLEDSAQTPPATFSNTEGVVNPPVLEIRKSTYRYGTDPALKPVLQDVSFSVGRGELLVVVGPVGSGKSSLLAVALGELQPVAPDHSAVRAEGGESHESGVELKAPASSPGGVSSVRVLESGCRIAYCAQRPWILATSVKANVTLAGVQLGDGPDPNRVNYKNPTHIDVDMYRMAVESSLIVDDMAQWPAYDDTEVGERGISVSGGQKARISLARAIYADSDCKWQCSLY
jgi:ABC-type multidrug transport system fused ATPase/permease subunit